MSSEQRRRWADAYLAQARADLRAAALTTGAVPSVFAMLLQMTFEKLAKAALLRTGQFDVARATRSHRASSLMVQAMRRYRGLLDPLGGPWPWHKVLNAVVELESAHPQLSRSGPCLEYPWQQAEDVCWPEKHLAIAQELGGDARSRLGREMLRFANLLSDRFDDIFS